MKFCTSINCMDGRVQLPIIEYLKNKFRVDYVDMITEAGPNRVIAEQSNAGLLNSIFERIKISIEKHGSKQIAVAGHFDCAGNPKVKDEQLVETLKAVEFLKSEFEDVEIIGLWVDENGSVSEC